MAIKTCERCGKQTAKLDRCSYCGRLLCVACIKSAKRVRKITRLYICKDCWGKISVRKKFKAA